MKDLSQYKVTPDPESTTQFEPFYQIPREALKEMMEDAFEAGNVAARKRGLLLRRSITEEQNIAMSEAKQDFTEWFNQYIEEI